MEGLTMKASRFVVPGVLLGVGVPLILVLWFFAFSWAYTTGVLRLARAGGVYATAEEGMNALIAKSYIHPRDSQIIYAGTNSFDGSEPHVWYVIACVWGGTRADGSPVGSSRHEYDQPGIFFIDTRDGWVQVGEGYFPEVLGYWMKLYGLAGPGSATPSHDWGTNPNKGCTFE
jgi:hypothetical protein